LVTGKLAEALFAVPARTFSDAEKDAYGSHLAAIRLESAAKKLADKRAERDALLFSGKSGWKYRKDLGKADASVEEARAAYDAVLSTEPEVSAEKPLVAAAENSGGSWFVPPKSGEERTFCLLRSYDALLLGRVESLFGRTAVSVRLYSPYLDADLYADEVVFSVAKREAALTELSLALAAAASGKIRASLSVSAEPGTADIHLSGVFSGKGTVGPLARDPGITVVEAELAGHEGFREELDLAPGEDVSLSVSLPPIERTDLAVKAFDSFGAASGGILRVDGLYSGPLPLDVSLPRNRLSFVQAEIGADLSASAVVRGDDPGTVRLNLTPGLPPKATPTEDARRKFYGAFGRFSLAMPLAFFFSGLAFSYENASIVYDDSKELAAMADRAAFASAALWTLSTAFAAESVVRFARYLRTSGERAVRPARIDKM
jgi:hypothetical protein